MSNKIEPTLGDDQAALEIDPNIDPPMGDVNACVCFDQWGNPINECHECPR